MNSAGKEKLYLLHAPNAGDKMAGDGLDEVILYSRKAVVSYQELISYNGRPEPSS